MKRANRRLGDPRAGNPVRSPGRTNGTRAVWYRSAPVASIRHNFTGGEITMKLYDTKMAPNPRRLRIFLAEKGIQVPDEQVDLAKAQNRAPEFLKINPMGGVPVLQLDDGANLAESVEMWQRRMEQNLFSMVTGAFRNTSDFFKGRIPQVPEYGEVCRQAAEKAFG